MAKKILQSYDFAGNQIIDARIENLASFPSAGKAGRLVLNSTTSLVGFDNGSAFRTLAPLDSPAFTGNPTVPTQTAGDNSTKAASTAYVDAAVTAGSVADNTITNAKLADMANARIKGRSTAGTGDPEDLTAAQVKTILAIAAADVSGLSTVATTGSAADLSGTLAAARLPAFGSGDVSFASGGGAGTVAANAITNAKLADMATARIKGRVTASTGDPEDLTAAQVKTMLAITQSDVSGLVAALAGKSDTGHTHTASQVTDFASSVDARIVAYFDTEAATDNDLDTLRELIDQIKANRDDLLTQIQRFEQNIGNGVATSIAVTHNLASRDVTVEVYDNGTYETVSVGVTRTTTNVVTIDVTPAPATNALRVVIKR